MFGRFYDNLEKAGLLENTWLVLTSDHGEMFERGIQGHFTPVLYQPVIRVPLMIFEPGRRTRADVYANTSAVDVVPTLAHVTGQAPTPWSEGRVLPPFAPQESERSIYVLQARTNPQYAPLTTATVTLVKGQYKLIRFFGYQELNNEERLELYDLQSDSEEMNNLYSAKPETAAELSKELQDKIAEMNAPYL